MTERVARHLDLGDVSIDDEFWEPRRETNRETTVEYQYDQLETSGCLENFRRAAAGESGGFEGVWFADSDAYKWLEAASYVLATREDPDLERRVDEMIDLVAAAQDDDGYLNTYFALEEPDARWTNLNMMHELYCAGHLIEAAVAHHRATGRETLLDVATAFADHVDDVFPEAVDGVPGHQEIELALVQLARVTGERRYVDLAEYFVDLRGHEDRLRWELEHVDEIAGYDPDEEHGGIAGNARRAFYEDGDYENGEYDGSYAQAHAPFLEQDAVEGHSVRAMYYYCGVADVAAETGREELLAHLETLWENMTTKRMYVTGGIGSTEHGERFTEDYDLPNDTAYAETCAAIGSVFWNRRLFESTGDARYHDLVERMLYNAVLAGVSLDGTAFFYDNRLASDGSHTREGWFDCACCPPNVARLIAELERYVYAGDGDDLYVTQYVGSTATLDVDGTELAVEQTSAFPWDGDVTMAVSAAEPTDTTVHLRVPEWCEEATVQVNGERTGVDESEGFVAIEREWDDDRIEATFEMDVEVLRSHPAVEADAGRVALRRGPLVYCLESVDNDRPLHQYRVGAGADLDADYRPDLLDGVSVLRGRVGAPSPEGWEDELYRPASETAETTAEVTAVPYYAWDNRASGPMTVWIHDR